MYEVELKAPADHDRLRERLAALDADHLGAVTQVDTYYDAPHRDFAATDEALRVRLERDEGGETAILTYKGPRVDETTKTRQEAETAVEEGEPTRMILTELGFQPAATVHKERDRYALEECHVTLDAVRDLGEYVEVEYSASEGTEAADVDAAQAAAVTTLERLGLGPADTIRTSYLGLLLEDED